MSESLLALLAFAACAVLFARGARLHTPARLAILEDVRRTPPTRPTAIPLYCRWCATTTFHLRRRQHTLVCEHRAEHHATEAYRMLAATFADSACYPGCICAPGERTIFNGKPDPFCFALDHRP